MGGEFKMMGGNETSSVYYLQRVEALEATRTWLALTCYDMKSVDSEGHLSSTDMTTLHGAEAGNHSSTRFS